MNPRDPANSNALSRDDGTAPTSPEPRAGVGAPDAPIRAQICKRVFYPHPPEAVWAALTDPAALAEWLMPNDFRPVVGHRFRFACDPCPGPIGNVTQCEVLALDPPRRMLWSWHMSTKAGLRPAQPLLIEWTLTEHEGGTRLTLRQSAYDGPRPWMVRFMMTIGWGLMLKRLVPKVLERVRGGAGGVRFEPGAIPREKRGYRVTPGRTPEDVMRGLTW